MSAKMNILAIIPARGGSKGVPQKNLKPLGRQPLVAHVIQAAKNSRYIDKLIISTDDKDIGQLGTRMGLEIPFMRPTELATDNVPLIAVVLHAYNYFKKKNIHYDAVLSVQPTCPFLTNETIDKVVELWLETNCESVVTIAQITKGHPYIAKRLYQDNVIDSFLPIPEGAIVGPRQKREPAYFLTGGIYLRAKRLLDTAEPKGHCLGKDTRAVVVDEFEAVDINDEFDFKFAEFLLKSGHVKI
jgi:CMP-N,N'-diacetyllegionaminic acid synthase